MRIFYYNQRKNINIKIVIFWILTLIIAVWSFFWLPYFRISEVEISDPLVSKREIEGKLGLSLSSLTRFFLPRNNFFLFPSDNAEKIILESGLGVAEIEKKFPNKISIEFTEIKPKFLYCKEQNCFYIDAFGVPYETAPFFSESPLPILDLEKKLKIGEEFFEKNDAIFILEFQKELKKLGIEIKNIKIGEDLKLTLNEGWYLILLLGEKNSADIANKLSLLFERKIKDRSNLEYIDMRFTNKAFYKLMTMD